VVKVDATKGKVKWTGAKEKSALARNHKKTGCKEKIQE
jgi:hypothetical protein